MSTGQASPESFAAHVDVLLDEAVLSVDAQYLTLACPWQAFVHLRCATCVSPSECSLPHWADPSWT